MELGLYVGVCSYFFDRQELKKKELENLDELLADFGVKTKLTEETEGGLASPSAHGMILIT